MKPYCVSCRLEDCVLIQSGRYNLCWGCVLKIRDIAAQRVSDICAEYAKMDFASFQDKQNVTAVKVCHKFALRETKYFGLLLYSNQAGNGKTHLGISILKEWLKEKWIPDYEYTTSYKKPFEVVTEPNLFLDIRKSFSDDSEQKEWDITEKYSQVEFLLIDDLGKYSVSDAKFLQRVWYNILNERYLNHRLTVITSNKNGAELQEHLGQYTFDRICGMCDSKITEVVGSSYRRK